MTRDRLRPRLRPRPGATPGARLDPIASGLLLACSVLAGCGGSSPSPDVGAGTSAGPSSRTRGVAAAGAGWSQAGGDPARTRTTTDEGPLAAPGILWSGLIDPQMATEPVLAVGANPPRILVAGPDNLRALDLATGRELWMASIEGAVGTAPSSWQGAAWLATLDGLAAVIGTADGKTLRTFEADYLLEAPSLVAGGLLVFEETSVSGRDRASRLHALDPATLEPRWTHDFSRGASAPPATDGERVFVQTFDSIFALLLADGEPLWRWERETQRQVGGPVVAGGRVVFHASTGPPFGSVGALDAKTGELLWHEALRSRVAGSPALTETEIHATVLPDLIQCRDAATGAVKWETKLPARAEASPALTPRRVLVGGDGFVASLDRATGEIAWTLAIDGEVAHLSVVGKHLLVATFEGFVHCVVSPE